MSRGLGLDVAAVTVRRPTYFNRRADAHVPALLSVTVTGEPSRPPTVTKSQCVAARDDETAPARRARRQTGARSHTQSGEGVSGQAGPMSVHTEPCGGPQVPAYSGPCATLHW